ncbi:hypothetical protein [Escherichia coli]|uniref:hypothetical protein n=1 Tax=Escherichia coli TaxID=562 RepID=UPI000DE3421D|nr:hypothetical protein [Escherichia coli]
MGSCAAPSAKGDDKFITTDYLQQCQNFYETTNFMGQTVREFGASKITVWWGSIYAKIAYASLAGLIGYGVKVATDD